MNALPYIEKEILIIRLRTLKWWEYLGVSNYIKWVVKVKEGNRGVDHRHEPQEEFNPPSLALKVEGGDHKPRNANDH